MTGPASAPDRPPHWPRTVAWLALAALCLTMTAAGYALVRGAGRLPFFRAPEPPRVSHDLVVQQVRDVAKLVTTEMTVRDVVVYEGSRYGFTKRALLVVTGKVLAGIDLGATTDVRIDDAAKTITVAVPPARVLGIEVIDVRTYDERAGLLNPFRPEDRDAIQRQVRHQLYTAGAQSGVLAHADSSARELLVRLLARDGYAVRVEKALELETGRGDPGTGDRD